MRRVLVTDANNRVALAAVRALGRSGWHVVAVEQRRFARRAAAFSSRFVRQRRVHPDFEDPEFPETLERWSREVDVVLPISTNAVLTIARYRDRIRAAVPLPSLEVLRRVNDKPTVLKLAEALGIPVPGIAADRYPQVVKLRNDEGTYLSPGQRYRIVHNEHQKQTAVSELSRWRDVVVQEFIPGGGYGVGVLLGEEVHAAFVHRRVREFPVTGGPSTACVSIVDDRMIQTAVRLLKAAGWRGAAMVEFRRDRRDGRDVLMEINPRLWGALPLALRAGVNVPDLMCRWALGDRLGSAPGYRAGIRLRFLPLEVRTVLDAFRKRIHPVQTLWGVLRDALNPAVADGILDPFDAGSSLAYLLGRR